MSKEAEDIYNKDGKMDKEKIERVWTTVAEGVLLNKKIVKVEYLTEAECKDSGWHSRPIAFQLDDGIWVIVQSDDEGNDGGALYYTNVEGKFSDVIPVL